MRRCSLCMWTVPPAPRTAPPLRKRRSGPHAGWRWLWRIRCTATSRGPLGDWQWMVWHLFAVWYVLARCGMLAQGQSGSLAPLDALAGFVLLPFGNFFLRARTVFAALRTHLQDRTGTRKVLHLIVTAAVTLALCGVAWGLLAAADANFAAAGAAGVRLVEQAAEQYEIH